VQSAEQNVIPATLIAGDGIGPEIVEAEFAFEYAVRNGRKKVTLVNKANILQALSGLRTS
jgi:isocitrate/isopropylmalate dehydrogenase